MVYKNLVYNFLILICFLAPQTNFIYSISIFTFIVLSVNMNKFSFSNERQLILKILKVGFSFILLLSFTSSQLKYGFEISNDILKPFILLILIYFSKIYHSRLYVKVEILFIILFLLTISQLAYIFNLELLKHFIDSYFYFDESKMISTHRSIYDVTSFNIRSGGIYRNPNQMSKFINLLSVIFLVSSKNYKTKSKLLFLIIALISILLTGSRTGFFVFSFINFIFFRKGFSRYIFLPILVGFLIHISNLYSLRSLKFNSLFDLNESLINRKDGIFYWLDNSSIFEFLIGHFYNSSTINTLIQSEIMFDSDLISSLFSFGFIGAFLIYFFYFKIILLKNLHMIFPLFFYVITSGFLFDLNFIILLTIFITFNNTNANNFIRKKI